ncbi:MAG TPA: aminopeptidase P N-terminal domain-containing protein [Candidatus Caccousia avistercoris]|nr:aminopeptidase P N-terminal domain-containing protein [Candidatus Caccousia avistercoris]
MQKDYYQGNRGRLYAQMKENSLLVLFSGMEVRKTNDEYYPFYTDRNFLYLTGLEQKDLVFVARKDGEGHVKEKIYILPPDMLAERWNGARIQPQQASDISGVEEVGFVSAFEGEFHSLAAGGNYQNLYLDLFRVSPADRDAPSHLFLKRIASDYPFLHLENANILIRRLRLIKQPCELEAMRRAEEITCAGITSMMKASRPGMYEYQYKAVFDYVLGQYGPQGPGFPSIISAGQNNFCIHYYSYKGQAHDGDMVLNDVGACHDSIMTDVSRGWPCNGKFSERQALLYNIALQTSDHMFRIIKPGMAMQEVDGESHRYCARLLVEAGVLDEEKNIHKYMWHGGAHHVGLDVHDAVAAPQVIGPNMVFCVDIGIYHEEWGIGFRLEDNCLVTEDGCENLSAVTPRTIPEIEAVMRQSFTAF